MNGITSKKYSISGSQVALDIASPVEVILSFPITKYRLEEFIIAGPGGPCIPWGPCVPFSVRPRSPWIPWGPSGPAGPGGPRGPIVPIPPLPCPPSLLLLY